MGLRAEWQASPQLVIGFELKEMFALTAADDNQIAVTDEGTRTLRAVAHMAARRHTLATGMNVRWFIQRGASYQYKTGQ